MEDNFKIKLLAEALMRILEPAEGIVVELPDGKYCVFRHAFQEEIAMMPMDENAEVSNKNGNPVSSENVDDGSMIWVHDFPNDPIVN